MNHYTDQVIYKNAKLHHGEIINPVFYNRQKIEPEHPSYQNQWQVFSQSYYKYPFLPLHLGEYSINHYETINTNVLRLLIKDYQHDSIYLPKELMFLKEFILDNINYHQQFFPAKKHCFVYLTVRTAQYRELYYKEACHWHVDGFQGYRLPRHIVEQDIFWSNMCPTQFLLQPMFCEGLNPVKHDINQFFNYNANSNFAIDTQPFNLYLTTPYNIHRACIKPFEGNRLFIRLNFSPVEIKDPTNIINPMLPRYYAHRNDVRNFLSSYYCDETKNYGFDF